MNVEPTVQGGLKITAASHDDWEYLDAICTDAESLPGSPVYDRISSRMKKDADWEEFVAPDIRSQFSDQIKYVTKSISSVPKSEEGSGSIFISKEDAMDWYGTLNQARMNLEYRFKISELGEIRSIDDLQGIESEMQSAVVRSHFYSDLQCFILKFVIDIAAK